MAQFAHVLLFVLGTSLAVAATLAVMPAIQSHRHNYRNRIFYFLWRYGLPAVLLEELVLRLVFGRFYP